MSIETINPATGKVIKQYSVMTSEEVHRAIEEAHAAHVKWREMSLEARAEPMLRVAETLIANSDYYASLITTEMGKPIAAARAEIEKCAKLCRYYAEEAERFLQPTVIETEVSKSFVTYRPLGVIFAIMPWNFPFWQVLRYAAPNLMAGNTCLLKHAPISTGTALAIQALFEESGFKKGLFTSLLIDVDMAEYVISHKHVAGVTLTGSERAGASVAKLAGENLKKVVLELGGSDPYVILADADIDHAAKVCVASRLNNSGQVCIAAKRFIVVKEVEEAFKKKVMGELEKYSMGDPTNESNNLGPLARADLREGVHQQVQACVSQGARLVKGGEIPHGDGFFYPITVLDDVKNGMPAYNDEIFGPVIVFISASDEDNAIEIANDTRFGLGASVFTQDVARGEKIAAERLYAGTVCVNRAVASDQRLPFGGVKASGFGRELSAIGMHEFVNIKTVCIE